MPTPGLSPTSQHEGENVQRRLSHPTRGLAYLTYDRPPPFTGLQSVAALRLTKPKKKEHGPPG